MGTEREGTGGAQRDPYSGVRGEGMLTGSNWRTTKPKQTQDPKLPRWPIHKEDCQDRTQQGGEQWKIHGSLLKSQQLGRWRQ
jgi:hypothetical protein